MKDRPRCQGRQSRPGKLLWIELDEIEGKGLQALGKLLRKRIKQAPTRTEVDSCRRDLGHEGPCMFPLKLSGGP